MWIVFFDVLKCFYDYIYRVFVFFSLVNSLLKVKDNFLFIEVIWFILFYVLGNVRIVKGY